MGLLTEGNPLSWEETKKLANHVRKHGIIQFINLYKKQRDRQGDLLKWGDEVEYIIVKFDDTNKKATLSLCAQDILKQLNDNKLIDEDGLKSLWRPEFGAFMIEGSPGKPYGGLLAHFNIVEANMKYRRAEATLLLGPGEHLMTFSSFPRMGCPDFTTPSLEPQPETDMTQSLFFPNDAIFSGNPRHKTLDINIRQRRGEKVAINLPVFQDINTKVPQIYDKQLPNHVYMDSSGFGLGCCCLQVTLQAYNITEARTLYDQLTPFCPIMLALSAACPIFKGYLTEVDTRWMALSGSGDCRTRGERGIEPMGIDDKFKIQKSRFGSTDSYLSTQNEKYNDIPLTYDEDIYGKLLDNNIDHLLSQHIAHLFIRDTLLLLSEKVNQNDEEDTDHFENIQSTNWQTMRFKPPPPLSSIGWRVEFRPCEVQLTDFENAAFACFIILLTRAILSFQLNFVIPISKVDDNMQKAQKRDACRVQKFWWRRDVSTGVTPPEASCADDRYEEMTINEIFNGKEGVFPGLIAIVKSYLSGMDVDVDTHCSIQQYLKLIQKRASGELLTTASYLREFVTSHPQYKRDSVVSDEINYDLLKRALAIQNGELVCPRLLGNSIFTKTKETIPEALRKVLSKECP